MAFKDFTSTNKVKQYKNDLIISSDVFLPKDMENISYSSDLEDEILFNLKSYKPNEAYANHFLIAPIINQIWRKHQKLNVWTEQFIKIDEKLNGRPDYLISPVNKNQYTILSLPIVVLVEAKQDNFTAGWGQCLAEMVACQQLNKSENVIIHGIVATGQVWEFGKLDKLDFVRNSISYNISNLQQTLNIVNYIFNQAEKEIPKLDLSIILPDNEQDKDEKSA